MVFALIYLLFSLVVAIFAFNRRIGVLKVLLISLILTPLAGILIILKSDRNIIFHHYTASKYCRECRKKLNSAHVVCPYCGTQLDPVWDFGLKA